MAFVDVHTGIPSSPKHAPLSDAAFRLWMHALCWSKEHLTDGFIPAAMLPTLHPRGRKVVTELLAVMVPDKGPLWHEVEGGYRIHDYAEWQETKDRVQERRQQWRERKSRSRVTLMPIMPDVTRDTMRDTMRDSREIHGVIPSDVRGRGINNRQRREHTATKKWRDDALFVRFYDAYPAPVNPARAYVAWCKHRVDEALLQRMLDALEWQKRTPQWTKDDGAYIPHPATWLNAEGWESKPQTTARVDAPAPIDWTA